MTVILDFPNLKITVEIPDQEPETTPIAYPQITLTDPQNP